MEDIGTQVHYTELEIGVEYYTMVTGYKWGVNIPMSRVRVVRIQELPAFHGAMVFCEPTGYAVGGIFEGDMGPKNRFWRIGCSQPMCAIAA